MFATLMEGAAWIIVLAVLAFMLVSAGVGALIGKAVASFMQKRRP